MRQLLPLVTGLVTIAGMWLAGSKKSAAWILGLANQALWLAFIVVFAAWGLLPLNFALVIVYSRNLMKWRREDDLSGHGSELLGRMSLRIGVRDLADEGKGQGGATSPCWVELSDEHGSRCITRDVIGYCISGGAGITTLELLGAAKLVPLDDWPGDQ